MATLEKIRSKAGLLVGVVGLALFAFIIGDFLNSGSSFLRQSQEKIAEVDGTSLTIQDYQKRIDEMVEMYKLQSGNTSLPEDIMTQIRESVYETMVRETVLGEQLDELGIQVTPEELFDMVQGDNMSPIILQMPMFQDAEGRFNKASLLQMLKAIDEDYIAGVPADQQAQLLSLRRFWLFWEKTIKQQRLEEKYTSLISKGIVANKLEGRYQLDATATTADILFTTQPFSTIPDSIIKVKEGEIEELYEQRKERYCQHKAQVVDYIAVDIVPSADDYEEVRSEIESLREEFTASEDVADLVSEHSDVPFEDVFAAMETFDESIKSFLATAEKGHVGELLFENDAYRLFKLVGSKVGPDSVKVSHIMVSGQTESEVTVRVDSILNELRKGADFGHMAADISVDKQSAEKEGDLGWFTEAGAVRGLSTEFKDTIFAAGLNEVKTVKSIYGTHLVKVTEKTANVIKYKVADITVSVSPSSETYSNIYNALNQYIANNNNVEKFKASAQDAGYRLRTEVQVSVSDQTIDALKNTRQVVRWVFEHGKGDVSEIFECDNKFVVAVVEGSLSEGYRPLDEELSATLKQELVTQKKGELIVKELKEKGLKTLAEYAEVMNHGRIDSVKFVGFNTSRIMGMGVVPKLNAYISLAEEGQVSPPVAGSDGVHVFEVIQKHVQPRDGDHDDIRQAEIMTASNGYRYQYQLVQSLLDKAKVEDLRIRFY
ncbi:MAG: SurA N-terminal domain-containing protein [Tannerellaceae bacterium]|jgi:peptidyl-prolyl cis-trans isomerase D|nr:SurA N-terminal domain-containing protein [Tannerellaceae bacterium]